MQSISNDYSIDYLSNVIVSQREARTANIVELLDNLQLIKYQLKQSGVPDVVESIEKAIDQCQKLKLLN
ncbi:hypothetical protein [Crocosphaera chwakensis]|uniref:Uncharacterized protein n=1 Tax=Crocosphaera chwakensis CCY0110 TaxID=391612 RepID=A3IKK8_9CHRO|nr:hypothetical protein [Crocosphaera chwakensis]EAZ93197.1 hypothetical protein CY0110_03974 [Crocosphaera chwakensis CCY0110]